MKKIWIFLLSSVIAITIANYSKKSARTYTLLKPSWKTFEKKSNTQILGHQSTSNELETARIPSKIKREIAQEKSPDSHQKNINKDEQNFYFRDERILMGDSNIKQYQDEATELEMVNKVSSDWKEILGNDLLRFQKDETKVLIKEEFPVIKIQNGKGQYLEQVIITYTFKNGNFSSFRALIDSETGFVTSTWDKTVNEKVKPEKAGLTLPSINNSGIIAK